MAINWHIFMDFKTDDWNWFQQKELKILNKKQHYQRATFFKHNENTSIGHRDSWLTNVWLCCLNSANTNDYNKIESNHFILPVFRHINCHSIDWYLRFCRKIALRKTINFLLSTRITMKYSNSSILNRSQKQKRFILIEQSANRV